MTSPVRNQISDWLDELFRVDQDVRLHLERLSEEQFQWRPAPGKWSVGECLNHLAITTGLVVPNIRAALDRGRVEGIKGEPPFEHGWLGGWFVRAMETPGKRGMRAPANFVPPAGLPKSAVLGRFAAVQQELKDVIESAPGLALDKLRAPSAAKGSGWIKLNVAAWIASTLAHERRHVAQALRLKKTPGFPILNTGSDGSV
jgi:hypothetical protein